jgi:hypothetical protein
MARMRTSGPIRTMDAKPLNAIILAALNIQIFDLEFTYAHFSLLLKFAHIAPFSKH